MKVAKVFSNGGSQAIRLPKDYRFEDSEVLVNQIGGAVIILPKNDPWAPMMESLDLFTDDFLNERPKDSLPQERDEL